MNSDITTYNQQQTADNRQLCERLEAELRQGLPGAESKLWHGAPVWFINGNPIAGYDVLKDSVRVLFWSGQSFEEPGLQPEGSFKAAEVRYTDLGQVDSELLQRCLKKAQTIQWDYKNIVKHRGVLGRIDTA